MKQTLLRLLACPDCGGDLSLSGEKKAGEEIMAGTLTCAGCARAMPITNGVPRLLPRHLAKQDEATPLVEAPTEAVSNPEELQSIQRQTQDAFGFQWSTHNRFGWDDPTYDLEGERKTFLNKSLLTPEELPGKVVLDAGCGNGRYSYWGGELGGETVGVDLIDTEPAFRNVGGSKNNHVVQGDIFNLPFKKDVFDVIFSIGVLMHTGDAKRATQSLTKHLKPGGSITIHLYHKGTPIYEVIDAALRRRTTTWPREKLLRFTEKLHRLAKVLRRLRLMKIANIFMRLEEHPVCIHDWYAAPIATHHTYHEVYRWFKEFGLKVLRDHNRKRSFLSRAIFPKWSLTVRGIKPEVDKQP